MNTFEDEIGFIMFRHFRAVPEPPEEEARKAWNEMNHVYKATWVACARKVIDLLKKRMLSEVC